MARKKKNEQEDVRATPSDFGHGIWGLIILATGVLVLISLVSHFLHGSSNILGYYFGTCLSLGLIWVFGIVPSFFAPLGVIFFGWLRLKGESFKIRTLFFWVLTTVEICILLSVFHLHGLALDPEFTPLENRIGFFVIDSLFYPVFGAHQFGPYFITGLALSVTLFAVFRVSPQRLIGWITSIVNHVARYIATTWHQFMRRWEEDRKLSEEAAQKKYEAKQLKKSEKEDFKPGNLSAQKENIAENKRRKKRVINEIEAECTQDSSMEIDNSSSKAQNGLPAIEASVAAVVGGSQKSGTSEDCIDSIEEEARKRLENELAAFRAKKKEPIKIMTIETAEVESADGDDEDANTIVHVEELPELSGRVPDESEFAEEGNQPDSIAIPPSQPYRIPDPAILPDPPPLSGLVDKESIERNSVTLEKTLMNFGVEGKVSFVSPGPVVTRYEIELAPGIKVSRVLSLHDDISMAVNGQRIRIEAPIPGKSAVGIELPNAERQFVHFKHILLSDAFKKSKAKLPVIIGTNVSGAPYVTDIAKMPHVLIAGQTGSGKSVCINSIICSLLMTKKPEELRIIMIDPKKVELAFYENIPHLMSAVVTESKEAVKALQWGVIEMERRYRILAKMGARNIDSFNSRVEIGKLKGVVPSEDNKPLPFIVIIVDELADLMMTASKDVEGLIQRIAQLARAVGIHLIVATQRPSVDIITGPIKANLTSRIGFRTIQSTDSRTILGHVGAEKLLGMGDMLFLRNGAPEIERFHGAFISEEDVEKIVADIRDQKYKIEKLESFLDADDNDTLDDDLYDSEDRDQLFEEAARIIVSIGQGSTSLLQRRMKIGYARAGRLMDELERAGFVGPPDGSKAREVLVRTDELDEYIIRTR